MRRRLASATTPVHRHSLIQLLVDGALVALAYYLAFRLRFDRGVPARYDELLQTTIVPVVIGTVIIFALSGMYQRWWRFLGQRDYERLLRGVVIATLALVGLVALIHPVRIQVHKVSTAVSLPLGVAVLFFLLTLLFCGGARFLVRAVRDRPPRGFRPARDALDVLIVGAGSGGQAILREILRNPALSYRPVGFLDDNPRMRGLRHEEGVPVLGGTTGNELPRVLDEVEPDEVIIAIPSAPGTLRARVMTACRARGIPVRTQLERVGAYLNGQVVMVTGAGGSIGAELCRQIGRVGPKRLVLVDHAEDNLFAILRELEEDRHVRNAVGVLADCREEERMREVLGAHRPAVVFHAAAYKHVEMMERNPIEAVRNNALATRIVAHLAGELGVG